MSIRLRYLRRWAQRLQEETLRAKRVLSLAAIQVRSIGNSKQMKTNRHQQQDICQKTSNGINAEIW